MATKILKNLTFNERCNMFVSRMQTSNWVEIKDTKSLEILKFNLDVDLWDSVINGNDWFSLINEEKANMYILGSAESYGDTLMLIFIGNEDTNIEGKEFYKNSLLLEVCNSESLKYKMVSFMKDYGKEDVIILPVYFSASQEVAEMMEMSTGFQPEFLEVLNGDTLDLRNILDGVLASKEVTTGNLFEKYINGKLLGE